MNTLIGKGVSFEIKDVEVETQSRFFGLVKKHIRNEVTRKYTINEPTLATLDRLSREWVEFAIDDDALKSADGMTAARTLAAISLQGKSSTERRLTHIRLSWRSSSRSEIESFMPLMRSGSLTSPSASPLMK